MRILLFLREKLWCLPLSMLIIFVLYNPIPAQEEGEETYSITLTQTAELDREIHVVDDKKVLTETYTVKKGDYIWQLFRKRGLLQKRNLGELLSALKKLNVSLTNIDLIHPGETIIIPLTIAPIEGIPVQAKKEPPTPISLEDFKDLELEDYTIKKGDSIVKILKNAYALSDEDLYTEYLRLVRKVNPDIADLNRIYPGQRIKLPIYSPQVVRKSIKPPSAPFSEQGEGPLQLGRQLGEVFTQMGEEWVQTGKHFIPLKSGGQIDLKADSYPILNLSNGNKIIVDLYNDMPDNMATLITSSWNNYRIVHIESRDTLRTVMEKIIPLCNFHKVYSANDPLLLGGDLPLRITADWIIERTPETSDEKNMFIVITLLEKTVPRIPKAIRDFLESLRITVIDYPPEEETPHESLEHVETLHAGGDALSLIETILNTVGQGFMKNVDIPIYQSEKTDFNLTIKADLFLNVNGRDCIIDLKGLGEDITTLLMDHHFSVLSLSEEKEPSMIAAKILDLLDVPFDSKPHPFLAADRDESKNVKLMIQGIVFPDKGGQRVFATPSFLSQEIVNFLSQKGYRILYLGP